MTTETEKKSDGVWVDEAAALPLVAVVRVKLQKAGQTLPNRSVDQLGARKEDKTEKRDEFNF